MQKRTTDSTITVPVPLHDELRRGTLLSIIRQAGLPRALFEQVPKRIPPTVYILVLITSTSSCTAAALFCERGLLVGLQLDLVNLLDALARPASPARPQ